MKPDLQTFDQCCENIGLFKKWRGPTVSYEDGMYISHRIDEHAFQEVPWCFTWISSRSLHRLDGPSRIWDEGNAEWHFMGERVYVNNQKEFDDWIISKI